MCPKLLYPWVLSWFLSSQEWGNPGWAAHPREILQWSLHPWVRESSLRPWWFLGGSLYKVSFHPMTLGKGEIPFHGWESRCSNSHLGGRWQAGPAAWISRLWAQLSPATSSLLTISLSHGWTQSPWATYLPDGVTEALSPQLRPCWFLHDGVPVTGSFPKARKVLSPRPPSCCQLLHACLQLCVFRDDPYHAAAAAAKSLQSWPTLCDPIDGSPPGSPVPGILQARTLEWVAIPFSNAWKWKAEVKSLSCVRLLVNPWTAAYQATPSMGFFQSRVLEWGAIAFSTLPH